MNTTNKWIILLLTAFTTGGGVTYISIQGGCKIGMAIFAGALTGASAVLHNLSPSANDTPLQSPADMQARHDVELTKLTQGK